MKIQINHDYRITSDKYNYILEKKHISRKLDESWRPHSYYGSLSNLVSAYPDVILKESDANGIAEALEVVKNACAHLTHALSPEYEVIIK